MRIMTADEARALVIEKYPAAIAEKPDGARFQIFSLQDQTYRKALSGWCKTEDAAWLSAAKRLRQARAK